MGTPAKKYYAMEMDLVYITFGLVLLYYGGDILISGCLQIAHHFKIPHFIIGATIMGFGTSAPELCVSILAALRGAPELAIGNVLGSNVANIGLVLGISALLAPIVITPKRFKKEAPPLIFATLLFLLFAWDLALNRWEGLVMVAGIILYVGRAIINREDPHPESEEEEVSKYFANRGIPVQVALIIVGLVGLVLGADWMVKGSVNVARAFGVNEWLIGITIVAVGTSLPEIASSTMAAYRGHGEMALGNIFGSNIFNIMMVLGVTSVIRPMQITEPIVPDLLICAGITGLLLIQIQLKHKLNKADGVILLVAYFSYIVMKSSGVL